MSTPFTITFGEFTEAEELLDNDIIPIQRGIEPGAYYYVTPQMIAAYVGEISGAVTSVNGLAGDVLLTQADIPSGGGFSQFSTINLTKLNGIQAGAQANTVDTVAGRGGNVVLTKTDVGLDNVDNTSDANKPVSTAQQTALNLKANLSGAAFSGAISATNLSGTNTGDQTNITGNAGTVTTINGKVAQGTNVTITGTGTDASPYVINASGGGGGGDVDSVNGQTGVVVLDTDDISEGVTNKYNVQSDWNAVSGLAVILNKPTITNGTVTSLALSAPTGLTVGGSPVTSAGTLALTLTAGYVIPLQSTLDGKVDENAPITGATFTKITYDAKGLVTSGSAATTADINDSTNRRYVNDAQLTVIGNTSGTNTGDQTSVTGNAGTATALQTARTINGVSFDGTANINVPAPTVTASRAIVSDGSGVPVASTTTAAEIGFVNGVTSGIQSQLDAKQATITGAATTIVSSDLTASRALTSDGSGKVAASATTSTELGYLSGVTSAIQTQLNGKISSDVTGITGADAITNAVSLTQAEYDAIGAPNASTLYVIV